MNKNVSKNIYIASLPTKDCFKNIIILPDGMNTQNLQVAKMCMNLL